MLNILLKMGNIKSEWIKLIIFKVIISINEIRNKIYFDKIIFYNIYNLQIN